jgi:FMN phosphatase YigB (HAD superfamily)
VGFTTKYEMATYRAAERIAGATSQEACVLVDDSWGNMKAAKAAGWVTVLCGRTARDGRDASLCTEADYVIGTIMELPDVLPHLFKPA